MKKFTLIILVPPILILIDSNVVVTFSPDRKVINFASGSDVDFILPIVEISGFEIGTMFSLITALLPTDGNLVLGASGSRLEKSTFGVETELKNNYFRENSVV